MRHRKLIEIELRNHNITLPIKIELLKQGREDIVTQLRTSKS